jgi:hypothetical protein
MNPLLSVRNPFFVSSFVTTQLNKAGVAVNPREAAKLIRAPEREPLLIPAPLPMRSLSGAGIGAGAGNGRRFTFPRRGFPSNVPTLIGEEP